MEQMTISSIKVEDMAEYIASAVNESIKEVEEIQRTNPTVSFSLGRDKKQKPILVASVSFPEEGNISPMEYAERLIAAELIKLLVAKKMKHA